MATEKEIREAIAARIQTLAPSAVVVPRNILGIKNDGWLGLLQSPADGNKIHGWMVSLQSQVLIEDRGFGAEYELRYAVWQFLQYSTGDNTNNSEDVFSAERAAVIQGFAGNPPAPLEDAAPIQFNLIDIFSIGDRLIHIAQGSIAVRVVTLCA